MAARNVIILRTRHLSLNLGSRVRFHLVQLVCVQLYVSNWFNIRDPQLGFHDAEKCQSLGQLYIVVVFHFERYTVRKKSDQAF